MYTQTSNTQTGNTQTGNSTPRTSLNQNVHDGYVWTSQRRYPKTVVSVRFAVAIWLVFLGALLCSRGYWAGSLLFVAAALHVALAYRVLATSAANRAR